MSSTLGPHRVFRLVVLALLLVVPAPAIAQLTLALAPVASVQSPVGIAVAAGQPGRLFVISQQGAIRIIDGTQLRDTPFLDISSLVACCGEQGLLGLAFHPNYANNGFFYVNYTDTAGDTVVARYRVSATDPNVADPASAQLILPFDQPYANHNGGHLAFGPDGHLYIGTGDGGGGGDPENHAQNLGDLLGKILRIDVDGAFPYAIPASNPFVSTVGARGEIWSYGLRNPWRFSFDRRTGDMFIGDVGQNLFEEVSFEPAGMAGRNYGWRLMEGLHCYNPPTSCNLGNLTLPILEYGREDGCSVTGGYRYRGSQWPRLRGMYLYGDYCSGKIWGARPRSDDTWTTQLLLDSTLLISSFGEDAAGEVYVADHAGAISRITDAGPPVAKGDVNADDQVSVSDVFFLVNFLFAQGEEPRGSADVNGSSGVDVVDVLYLVNYLFGSGPAPLSSKRTSQAKMYAAMNTAAWNRTASPLAPR